MLGKNKRNRKTKTDDINTEEKSRSDASIKIKSIFVTVKGQSKMKCNSMISISQIIWFLLPRQTRSHSGNK